MLLVGRDSTLKSIFLEARPVGKLSLLSEDLGHLF